jgi:small subunit ribosomal protein S1
VDLGGIDGLLHITDMAWKRVKQPSDVVQVGDEITVKVLKFDRERQRVSLGIKQLGADPWESIERRYPPNTRLFGKVTNIADYGCFVEIEEGVEGLVHVSEMDWTNKNVNPAKVVQVGDEVEVMVLDIDEERRRISLGIKQCKQNPWAEFAENYAKNDKVTGQIKSITDFGIFVGLRAASMAWCTCPTCPGMRPGEEAVRNYRKGEDVDAVVLAIDSERERISLGIKQLDKDPFAAYIAETPARQHRHRRRERSRCEGRDRRPGRRHQRPAARLRTVSRSCRGCPDRAQGRRGGGSQVHRRRAAYPHGHAVDQGKGGSRGIRGGAELRC